ncbi:MAG: hypothetical protein IPM29_00470 [Planctomycetes bacterium]|nr:hypothetical protein [Planctomycetota bacterium]
MTEAHDDDFLRDLEERIARAVAEAMQSGHADVRERVAREVAAAVAVAARTLADLDGVLRAATRGAARAAREAGGDAGLAAAVEGLGEGVERAALGAKLAFEEAASRGQAYAGDEWGRLLAELSELAQRFVDVLGRAAARAGDEVSGEVGDLRRHAERARADFEPRARKSLDALAALLRNAAARAKPPAVDAARRTAGTVFDLLGDAMKRAGERLRGRSGSV